MTTRVTGFILDENGKRIPIDITVNNESKEIKVTPNGSTVEIFDSKFQTNVSETIVRKDWTIWGGGTRTMVLTGDDSGVAARFNMFPFLSRYLFIERVTPNRERR